MQLTSVSPGINKKGSPLALLPLSIRGAAPTGAATVHFDYFKPAT
jgi:hypothetical protein